MNIKNKKIYIWLVGLLGLILFFAAPSVLAQVNTGIEFGAYTGLVNTDIRIIVAKIIRAALGLLGIIALCLIIYGGYEYMTAGGKEEQIEKAKDIIKNTVIGLVIILSSLAIAQFVISRLTTSIIGNYCAENPTDPTCNPGQFCLENPTHPDCCVGPQCNMCTGAGCDIFYATSTPRGQLPIKNPAIFISFYRGNGFSTSVDTATVSSTPSSPTPFQNIIVYETNWQDYDYETRPLVPGYFEYLFNNTVVVFHPTGSCEDIPFIVGVGNNDCLKKNTSYTVELLTSSTAGSIDSLRDSTVYHRAIDCTDHSCTNTFTTGDKVDVRSPIVKANKPAPPGLVENRYTSTIGAAYSDDLGMQGMTFYYKYDLWDYLINPNFVTVIPVGSPNSLFGQIDKQLFEPGLYGYADRAVFETVYAYGWDFAGHISSSTLRRKVLPSFCWNAVVEPQYKETKAGIAHVIPDCGLGSECGNCPGEKCVTNADCAGTYCDPASLTCVARPKITDVGPASGAADNYISIAGYGFGASVGNVSFVTSTGSIQADVVSCPLNSPPTPAWTNFYTVVKVPAGVLNSTSSIRLETSNYNSTSNPLSYDITNDDWGWSGSYTYTTDRWSGLACVKPTSGFPGDTNIQMAGFNLGTKTTGYLKFGDLQMDSSALTWNETLISGITVPNLPEQILSLKAVINNHETNAFPFTILPVAEDKNPHIDIIDPTSGPVGSYITISGRNFGSSAGSVRFKKGEYVYTVNAPLNCGPSWTPSQVTIKVPDGLPLDTYDLQVNALVNNVSVYSNAASFTVNNNPLHAGFCSIQPNNGPEGTQVTLRGENFGGQGTVEYWKGVSSTFSGAQELPRSFADSQIVDSIPVGTKTGKVSIWSPVRDNYSNSLNFKIQNCQDELKKPNNTLTEVCGSPETKCCGNGVCVANSALCPEEEAPKFSVYGWAFTTDIWGKPDCVAGTKDCPNIPPVPPKVPRVLQQCGTYCTNPANGLVNFSEPCATTAECTTKYSETGYVCNPVVPSPSPSSMWPKSADICVNTSINVVFSESITNNGVTLTNANANDVVVILPQGSNTPIESHYVVTSQKNSINVTPQIWLTTSTVYNVLVTTKAKSDYANGSEANMPSKSNCPEYQGIKAAYCFSFTTKNDNVNCDIGSATIQPFVTVTSTLNTTLTDFFHVFPLAENNSCITLNGGLYNWNWHPSDDTENDDNLPDVRVSEYASISHKSHQDSDGNILLNPIQDLTIKNLETTANAEIITATWQNSPKNNFEDKIHGTAYLTLAQKKPEVIDFWPSCDGACRNGEIGFTFNIPVLKNSLWRPQAYYSNVTLESCPNTLCTGGATTPIHIKDSQGNILTVSSIGSDTKFTIIPDSGSPLLPNTYYRVFIRNASSTEGASLFVKDGPNEFFDTGIFYWIFHTKAGADSCNIASVGITPQTGTATWVGQQVGFTTQAYGSPDQCAPVTGQKLNSSNYNWAWSSANLNVATVSDLDKGAILVGSKAITGFYCGDASVQSSQNEQCDGVVNCALDCRNNSGQVQGTVACAKTNDLNCCGNNTTEDNEQCDAGLQNGQVGSGCTNSCLLTTKHPISINHCLATITNTQAGGSTAAQKLSACSNIYGAVSVCGNSGALEPGEQCDLGAQNGQAGSACSNICLSKAYVSGTGLGQCGNKTVDFSNNEQCDGGQDCTANCQFNVSSGDGRIDPFQYATAIGNGVTDQTTKQQTTTITAVTATDKTAVANFILQCGYKPVNAACTCIAPNTCGISEDTCCYERPAVETILPNESSNICPNSLLSVQFDQIMDTASFVSSTQGFYNIILAKSYTGTEVVCPAGELQVSKEDINPVGIWQNIKYTVRNFFGLPVEALINCEGAVKYSLKSEIISGNKTKVSLLLDKPLEVSQSYKIIVKDNVKNSHGVSLHFVASNDVKSYSTRSKMCKITDVALEPGSWLFTTTQNDSSDDDAGVATAYDKNNTDADKIFKAEAYFTDPLVLSAEPMTLQSFPGSYAWEYSWAIAPQSNLSIQFLDANQNVSEKKVQTLTDAINGLSQVGVGFHITDDATVPTTDPSNDLGKTFSTTSTVQVFICDNPWPSRNFHENVPISGSSLGLGYFDVFNANEQVFGNTPLLKGKAWTNFRLLYCRDYLQQGISDDLPELKKPVALYHTVSGDPVLKEFFLTFTTPAQGSTVKVDNDSIGIRIYPNTNHSSLMAWYKSQPWIPIGVPTPAKVGNYEALQEGRTYYINGLNTSSTGSNSVIYSNVYVFSFSDNPTNETLNIVKQLLDNLELNANLMAENSDKIEPMYRDFRRLQDLQATAKLLAKYRQNNGSYPQLNENPTLGTFLPSYTNSKWNSWQGVLGNLLGTAIPTDPLNGFYGCGSSTLNIGSNNLGNFDENTCWNAKDLIFACPNNSHVYQYNFVDGSHIGIKADFELDSASWIWDHPLQNTCSQSGNLCINNSECATGETCDSNSIGFTLNNSCNNLIISSATKCGVCQPGEYVAEACTPENDPDTTINESLYSGKKLKICKNDCSGFEYDLNLSLVHWWKADNSVIDSIGTANAVFNGNVKYGTGYNNTGKAFSLDGEAGTYLNVYNLAPINSNEYSVSFWVKPNTDFYGPLFSVNEDSGFKIFSINLQSNKKVVLDGWVAPQGLSSNEVQLVDGVWQFITFVKRSNYCDFYVDGYNFGMPSGNQAICANMSLSIMAKAFIGTNSGMVSLFKGAIDDVRMYNKALTATEVNDLYNNKSLPQCVSQGFCGDGVKQVPETCDDGSNNGKDGYCNSSCSNEILVCGNNQPDPGKEICDSSTFNKKWCSGNNIIDCTTNPSLCSGNSGTCVESGEKYAKKSTEQSCSWDCQSKEFCGDKIVQPQYESCETSESCQVGQCINSGTVNNGNFCEKNEDCQANIVCDNVSQTCSNDSTKSCTNSTDCKILAQCTSYVPGKKYCQAPGEFTILAQSVDGKTVYVDATTSPKISENDQYFSSIGCKWHVNPSLAAMPGVYCLPSAPIVLPPQSNSCSIDADKDGNYLDPGENCDNGPINGDIPPLGYNETKTYCDFGCDVATVSSGLYCGNGNTETPPEVCDIGIDYKNLTLDATDAKNAPYPTNFCENTSNKTFQYQSCSNDCGSFLNCPTGFDKQCTTTSTCPDILCGNSVVETNFKTDSPSVTYNEICDPNFARPTPVSTTASLTSPTNFCEYHNTTDNTVPATVWNQTCANSCQSFDSASCNGNNVCANAGSSANCAKILCGNGVLDIIDPANEVCDGQNVGESFCIDNETLKIVQGGSCSSQCDEFMCPDNTIKCTPDTCPLVAFQINNDGAQPSTTGIFSVSVWDYLLSTPGYRSVADIIPQIGNGIDQQTKGFTANNQISVYVHLINVNDPVKIKLTTKNGLGAFAAGKIIYNASVVLKDTILNTPSDAVDVFHNAGYNLADDPNPINGNQEAIRTYTTDLISTLDPETDGSNGTKIRNFKIATPETCNNYQKWFDIVAPSDVLKSPYISAFGACTAASHPGSIEFTIVP